MIADIHHLDTRLATRLDRRTTRVVAALLAALCLGVAACDDRPAPALQGQGTADDGPDVGTAPAPVSQPADTAARERMVRLLDIGGYADSAGAARLRDSLARAGWEAFVQSVAGDAAPWRVRVAPSREPAVTEAVRAGFAAAGRQVREVAELVDQARPTVLLHPVNRGTHGMSARLRWTVGGDRRALLVVEDPVSIEGDPLPNGFLLADERRPTVVQRDSVWDVAPSPDWQRVAYGRAYVISVGGRDSVGIGQWFVVAQRTNLDVEVLRRGSFPVSGMSGARGFAQPMIEPLAADSISDSPLQRHVTTPIPVAGGWRVRWSADGRTLAVGLPPARAVRDDAPPSEWMAVDAASAILRGELQSYTPLATLSWTEGPTLDLTTAPDPSPRRLTIEGGAVESQHGWVTVQGAATRGARRVVGPGAALAATRDGEFVLALAPVPTVRPGEPRVRAVVYQLAP